MWRELSSPLETSLTFSDRKEQAATLPCNGVENNSRSHLPDFFFFFFSYPSCDLWMHEADGTLSGQPAAHPLASSRYFKRVTAAGLKITSPLPLA